MKKAARKASYKPPPRSLFCLNVRKNEVIEVLYKEINESPHDKRKGRYKIKAEKRRDYRQRSLKAP